MSKCSGLNINGSPCWCGSTRSILPYDKRPCCDHGEKSMCPKCMLSHRPKKETLNPTPIPTPTPQFKLSCSCGCTEFGKHV